MDFLDRDKVAVAVFRLRSVSWVIVGTDSATHLRHGDSIGTAFCLVWRLGYEPKPSAASEVLKIVRDDTGRCLLCSVRPHTDSGFVGKLFPVAVGDRIKDAADFRIVFDNLLQVRLRF